MTRPFVCACGHGRSWHRYDMFGDEVCLLCAVCGREEREHWPTGHRFTECDCSGDAA
jgi:hypothetical protein